MQRQQLGRLAVLFMVVFMPLFGVALLAFMLRLTPPELVYCVRDPAALPAPPPGPDGRPANYLHTCGSRTFDASGRAVRIAGLNWFGMETGTYAPHGLWARNWREMLDQVAGLGYNTIRLPLSNEALEPGSIVGGVDALLNPDLQGLTGLEMLDRIVAGARERGLKIILDRHRPTAAGQSSLWYTREVPEERWLADWQMLAARYLGNDTVIAVDLHNEPRDTATWGSGDVATDWRLAAERAGNAVLAVNPYLLVLVQGVERYQGDWYWWGGDLQGVKTAPVRLNVVNRVVYSPHDYGPGVFEQGWFQHPRFPANLPGEWDRRWGYIQRSEIAPVVVGEFGGWLTGNERERLWLQTLLKYIGAHRLGSLNWALNPNSGDTGGILDSDWLSVVQDKQRMYAEILAPPIDAGMAGVFGKAPTRLKVLFRQADVLEQTSNLSFAFRILNDGPEPLDLHRLELRYWFTDEGAGRSGQQTVIDYAEAGAAAVQAAIVPVAPGSASQYLRLRFDRKAGSIPRYRPGGEVQLRVHHGDWSPYTQGNDHSFAGAGDRAGSGKREAGSGGRGPTPAQPSAFREWERVTLYLDGRLVWGQEP